MPTMKIAIAYVRILELHTALKLPPLKEMEGEAFQHGDAENGWSFTVNGKADHESRGIARVLYNGILAGLIAPRGGILVTGKAAGEAEADFIGWLEQEIRTAGGEPGKLGVA